MEPDDRKPPKRANQSTSKNCEIDGSRIAAASSSNPQHTLVPKEPQLQLGYLYEIDHTKLHPRTQAQLESIRVALVCEKTETSIAVRFPSKESLMAFFRYSTRETHPTLDERIVMGIHNAKKVLVKLVLTESFCEQKGMEAFWQVGSVSFDHMFKDEEEVEEEEEEEDAKIKRGIHVNQKRKSCDPKDLWSTERPHLKTEARRKIGHLLMHLAERLALGSNEKFNKYDPERPMEYWHEYADHVGIRKAAGISDPYWDPLPRDSPKVKLEDEVERLRR